MGVKLNCTDRLVEIIGLFSLTFFWYFNFWFERSCNFLLVSFIFLVKEILCWKSAILKIWNFWTGNNWNSRSGFEIRGPNLSQFSFTGNFFINIQFIGELNYIKKQRYTKNIFQKNNIFLKYSKHKKNIFIYR